MDSKSEIRAIMRLREKAFLDGDCAAKEDAAVMDMIERSAEFASARIVLSYMALPGEVQTAERLMSWHEAGKRIALPLVCGENLRLKEFRPGELVEGYRGIMEPRADAPEIDASEIDLALVPGVAFTREGMRLGRGKGFYDRLLPRLRCPKIGLCYSFRIIDRLPLDPWDAPLDKIVAHL